MAWDMIGECSYSLETSPPSRYPSSGNPFVDTSIETQMKALCTFPCCTSDIQCELAGPNCYCERSFYAQSDSIGYCTCKTNLPQQFDAEHDIWTTNGASQLVGVMYETPQILESQGSDTLSEVQVQTTAVSNSLHLPSKDPSTLPTQRPSMNPTDGPSLSSESTIMGSVKSSHRPSLSPTDEPGLLSSDSPVMGSVTSAFDIELDDCQFPCCTTDDQCGGGGCFCDMNSPDSENGKGQCGCDQGPLPKQPLDSEEENYCSKSYFFALSYSECTNLPAVHSDNGRGIGYGYRSKHAPRSTGAYHHRQYRSVFSRVHEKVLAGSRNGQES